jgi:TRAP-type C4-dicarboxylate transport system permease small subunit
MTDRERAFRRMLHHAGEGFAGVALSLAAVALFLVVALNAANVVLRYFFLFSLSWAQEAMLYLMIFCVYVGAIAVAWQEAHIRIDAILNLVPASMRRVLDVVSTLVLVAILVPIVIASFKVVGILLDLGETSDALQIAMWIPQSVVPVSLLLIIVLAIVRLVVPRQPGEGR